MPFDYTNMLHNMDILIAIFAKTPEQKMAAEKALAASKRYLQGFIEEALVEGLRKKGFIINDAATLQIVMQDYTKNVVAEYCDKCLCNGEMATAIYSPRGTLLLILEHLGVKTTLEMETELQNLDMEDPLILGG